MKIFTNDGLAKKLGDKIKLMKGETKSKVLKSSIAVAFVAISSVGLLTGCGPQDTKAPEETNVTPETGIVQTVEPTEAEEEEAENKFSFVWLSDLIKDKLANLDLDSRLNTERFAESITDAGVVDGIAVDEFGNPINPEDLQEEVTVDGNYFIAPDGSVWESEQDYLDYINQTVDEDETVIDTDDGYYHAPDGSLWDSEEEYLAYINGLNGGEDSTIIIDEGGDYEDGQTPYIAPDGSYWESEEAYLAYINANSDEYTDDTGAAEDTDDGYYHAPDGSLWDSEQAYLDYINSLDAVSETFEAEYEDTIVEDFSGYQAPDGSYWESEDEYNEYINASSQDYTVEDAEEVGTGEVTFEEDNSYFVAPDGSVWASESDYNDFVNSMSTTTEDTAEDTLTGTGVEVEDAYVETYDDDVEVIVAEPDYAAAQAELEAQDAARNAAPVESYEPAEDTTTVSEPVVSEPVEDTPAVSEPVVSEPAAEENDYYTAPDGSVWASKADYDMYMAAEAENVNQR